MNEYHKVINSPKSTMIALANACPKPNTMMIKLKYTFITVMTMLCSWRLHISHKHDNNHQKLDQRQTKIKAINTKILASKKNLHILFSNHQNKNGMINATILTRKPRQLEKAG
jgi:hypothetical protein